MKLFELTPITPDKFTPKERSDKPIHGKLDSDMEEIGTGLFAKAYASKTEPGTVRKAVQHVSRLENDAYFQYILTITKNERLSKNPYFPKIYDVQVFKSPEEIPIYSYIIDMERLHPFTSLSEEEMITIGRNVIENFDDWRKQPYYPRRPEQKEKKLFTGTKDALLTYIRQVAEDKVPKSKRMGDNIKDPNLKHALLFIRKVLRQQKGFFTDTHEGNIMVRRGRFTPQLVFTDPLGH